MRAKLLTLKPRVQTQGNRLPTLNPDSWRQGKQGSTQRGYTYRWQQASARFLRDHPLCQCPDCGEGMTRLRAATVVDHRIPHRGEMVKFWDKSNWQAMAKDCHDAKTALEDGGFGNPLGGYGKSSTGSKT